METIAALCIISYMVALALGYFGFYSALHLHLLAGKKDGDE